MIVVDTNVVSALMLPRPDTRIEAWLDRQSPGAVWTTSVTIYELRRGMEALPEGGRRSYLAASISQLAESIFNGRILAFDAAAAAHAASIWGARRSRRQDVHIEDNMIAGIVLAHGGTLATRNPRHFAGFGLAVINPWDD